MKMVERLRDGKWPSSSLSDIFELLKHSDVHARNPEIQEQPPGFDPLPSQQWKRKAEHVVEIEVGIMEIGGVPNVPGASVIPVVALPDEYTLAYGYHGAR
jgi:hypothetical protein